jgi:hypothetical protein
MKAAGTVLALALGLLAGIPDGSAAPSPSHSGKPCARLTVEFFPRLVEPGQGMDMDFELSNCSSVTERLVVSLSPKGPCAFVPASTHTYVLEANAGLGSSGLMAAPSCPGHYRVKAKAILHGRVLDRSVATFTVRHSR